MTWPSVVLEGAQVVLLPAVVAGLSVSAGAAAAGVLAANGRASVQGVRLAGDAVSAVPRIVLVLLVALLVPGSMWPLALTWACLATPAAMEEAIVVARQLGGARFVEAMAAHGFGPWRIFVGHLVGRNLRPMLVRQGAAVMLQVVWLEVGLSVLTTLRHAAPLTRPYGQASWAILLVEGYRAALGSGSWAALGLGLCVMGGIGAAAAGLVHLARARRACCGSTTCA